MSEQHQSFIDRFKGLGAQATDAPGNGLIACPTLGEVRAMKMAQGGNAYATFEKSLVDLQKAITSTSILDLRVVDITGPTQKINLDTVLRDWLSRKPAESLTDLQARIVERDDTGEASPVNLDDTSLPAFTQSAYQSRYNTATAFGLTVKGGWMSKAIERLQGRENSFDKSIEAAYTKIRRGENSILLNGVEQTSEVLPAVPQMHGFVTASTMNGITASGDVTVGEIDEAIGTLVGIYGRNVQIGILADYDETAVIDNIMINRYPGNNPMAHLERWNMGLKQVLEQNGLTPNALYFSRQATKPVPVFYEPMMNTGEVLVFLMDKPSLARFEFVEGQTDVVALARVEPTFYDVTALVDVITLLDPWQDSRVLISGSN